MSIKVTVKSPKAPLLEELMEHAFTNYHRVENLIQLYEKETKEQKGRRYNEQIDILRSAVVFAHATLEDGMRSIGRHYLPKCGREVLDKIPLLDINNSGKAEKFFLGRLVEHSEKGVGELIEESISSYLDKTSYTSASDISGALSTYCIDQTKMKSLYPLLDEMIKRRHQIVHKADKVDAPGPGKQYGKSLSAKQVRKWNDTVNQLFGLVTEEYVRPIFWPEEKKANK